MDNHPKLEEAIRKVEAVIGVGFKDAPAMLPEGFAAKYKFYLRRKKYAPTAFLRGLFFSAGKEPSDAQYFPEVNAIRANERSQYYEFFLTHELVHGYERQRSRRFSPYLDGAVKAFKKKTMSISMGGKMDVATLERMYTALCVSEGIADYVAVQVRKRFGMTGRVPVTRVLRLDREGYDPERLSRTIQDDREMLARRLSEVNSVRGERQRIYALGDAVLDIRTSSDTGYMAAQAVCRGKDKGIAGELDRLLLDPPADLAGLNDRATRGFLKLYKPPESLWRHGNGFPRLPPG